MSNIPKKEEIMDWAIRMIDGGVWNSDIVAVSVGIRHVTSGNSGKSYLVVSDCAEKEIWFPIGPGITEREVKNENSNSAC